MYSYDQPNLELGPISHFFVKAVRVILLVFLGIVWAIVGFVFWIAVLSRAFAAYSAVLTYAIISGTDPHAAARLLTSTIALYPRGFRLIGNAMVSDPPPGKKLDISIAGICKVILELLWVTFFWTAFLFMLEQYGILRPVISQFVHNRLLNRT